MWFGIWPGVVAADNVSGRSLRCPPEDAVRTEAALTDVQGEATNFFVRCYRHFGRGAVPHALARATPADPAAYLGHDRRIDLVACYQSPVPDADGFADFVRQGVRDVARWGGGKVQIGEEPDGPAPQDGGSPGCLEAIATGVAAALDERERLGADVLIGVNAAGMADPDFWAALATALTVNLTTLDYVGIDAFPDVFRPLEEERVAAATAFLLERFRRVTTEAGARADVPIHVTETGWPTDHTRDEDKQARVLSAVAHAAQDSDVDVQAFEWFGLRDGLTRGPWSTRFGILRDDYTPKPAYYVVRDLVAHRSTARTAERC